MKILIVEDNPQNLYLHTYLLEGRGHTVEAATDGKTGLEMALESHYDMILMDMQLPDMMGTEVAHRLTSNKEWKPVPIAAVTAFAMVGDKERALKSGFIGYIEKPIDPSNFVDTVETLFAAHGTNL